MEMGSQRMHEILAGSFGVGERKKERKGKVFIFIIYVLAVLGPSFIVWAFLE